MEVLGNAKTIQEGLQLIQSYSPNIVFLDVEIGEDNGFDFLKLFNPRTFELIFTTGHQKYAANAFLVDAIDYLLKPITAIDLIAAIEKVKKKLEHQMKTNFAISSKSDRITLSTQEGLHFVSINQISHLQGSGNYTTFFKVSGDKVVVSRPLRYFEEQLKSYNFFRIHQSFLVNIDYVDSLNKSDNIIILSTNYQVPLAPVIEAVICSYIRQAIWGVNAVLVAQESHPA